MTSVQDLVQQINTAVSSSGDADISETARVAALEAAQKLVNVLEKPEDALIKIAYAPAQFVAMRVASNLDLFRIIGENKAGITAGELEKQTGAEALLIERIMRILIATGIVEELAASTYAPTVLSETLCSRWALGMIDTIFDMGMPVMTHLPEYLRATGYKSPDSHQNGPFQFAHHTGKDFFQWIVERPKMVESAHTCFQGNRGSRPHWVDWFPVQSKLLEGANAGAYAYLLVDIAGSRGHDISAFESKFPKHPGRYMLADLPHVINDDTLKLSPRIEKVVFNFFTDSPPKGARIYYLKFVFHDWDDEKCLKILRNIVSSMQKGYSKLVVEEFIIPDKDCALLAATWDLQMMTFISGLERTGRQWTRLLGEVGLTVEGFYQPPGDGTGILVAELT